jgi:hypothetical protein
MKFFERREQMDFAKVRSQDIDTMVATLKMKKAELQDRKADYQHKLDVTEAAIEKLDDLIDKLDSVAELFTEAEESCDQADGIWNEL